MCFKFDSDTIIDRSDFYKNSQKINNPIIKNQFDTAFSTPFSLGCFIKIYRDFYV